VTSSWSLISEILLLTIYLYLFIGLWFFNYNYVSSGSLPLVSATTDQHRAVRKYSKEGKTINLNLSSRFYSVGCHKFIETNVIKFQEWQILEFPRDLARCIYRRRITAELHLSGLIRTTSLPVMQKIRIIGYF